MVQGLMLLPHELDTKSIRVNPAWTKSSTPVTTHCPLQLLPLCHPSIISLSSFYHHCHPSISSLSSFYHHSVIHLSALCHPSITTLSSIYHHSVIHLSPLCHPSISSLSSIYHHCHPSISSLSSIYQLSVILISTFRGQHLAANLVVTVMLSSSMHSSVMKDSQSSLCERFPQWSL
jgi:hypothetical protein